MLVLQASPGACMLLAIIITIIIFTLINVTISFLSLLSSRHPQTLSHRKTRTGDSGNKLSHRKTRTGSAMCTCRTLPGTHAPAPRQTLTGTTRTGTKAGVMRATGTKADTHAQAPRQTLTGTTRTGTKAG
eukprot:1137424-Pelagomonas_calceolata.AAC.1